MVQAWDLAVGPLRVATAHGRIWVVHDRDRGGIRCSAGANYASRNACRAQQQHLDYSAGTNGRVCTSALQVQRQHQASTTRLEAGRQQEQKVADKAAEH